MSIPANKIEQLQALKIGKGVLFLLNEAYKIFGNPVLTHDMEYKVISYTENIVTDDPIWNEFATTGTVGYERLEFYKGERFLDTAANARKIAFLRSDKLKYDRLYGKLLNCDKIQVGCACMVESHTAFTDDDPEAFEFLCDILNKELAKSEYYRSYGQAYQEILMNKLIEGSIEDKKIYTAHVESLYINLRAYLFLAVADIAHYDPTRAKQPYLRDLFKRALPAFKYSLYGDHLVIIISSDKASLDVTSDLGKLNRLFMKHTLYAGISGCFDNLFDLQKYYEQAVSALHDEMGRDENKRISFFEEIK